MVCCVASRLPPHDFEVHMRVTVSCFAVHHQVRSFGGVNVVANSSHYAQSIAMTAGDAFVLMTTTALGLAAA